MKKLFCLSFFILFSVVLFGCANLSTDYSEGEMQNEEVLVPSRSEWSGGSCYSSGGGTVY